MKIDISNKLMFTILVFPIVWYIVQTIAWSIEY
jgi:hypothetical protein